MGVRAWRARRKGAEQPPTPPKNGQFAVFWAMTKIWAEGFFGISNIALIHIERVYMSTLY